MEFNVYCDESYQDCINHENHNDAKYMLIGGIWLPKEYIKKLKSEIKDLKLKYNCLGELKWSKVSKSGLDFYREIIDLFWSYGNTLRFRCIIVDKSKIVWEKHDNYPELAFYKFYYQMLHHWIETNNEYNIYCDKKINRQKDSLSVLYNCLKNANIFAKVNGVYSADSKDLSILQLADFFTGLTAAKINDTVDEDSSKMVLIKYLEDKIGHEVQETYKNELKFNVFKIKSGGGW